MRFSSTNKKSASTDFQDVVVSGLAPDGGLYMPESWPLLPKTFFNRLAKMPFDVAALTLAEKFASSIPKSVLKKIVRESFNFPVPLKQIGDNLYVLELFHGPTMAFKDFGARFLSRALSYFQRSSHETLNIIVATSGDTGSAVASGFFNVPGINVYILYPSGKVSPFQERQLTTYGGNVTAIEIKGTFDDCQKLAKTALGDQELNAAMNFSSANSINFGRLLPQSFYYFSLVGQLRKQGISKPPVVVVPSGNFGNIFAGLMAHRVGLPISHFIAATNANDVVPQYLKSGEFVSRKSKSTISNAMDVGNPSNFARILAMFGGSRKSMASTITGISIADAETKKMITKQFKDTGYILDPHTAVGVSAAQRYRASSGDQTSPIVVLSTAHPAKFSEVVEPLIGKRVAIPKQFKGLMRKKTHKVVMPNSYEKLKSFLLSRKSN